MSLLPIDDAEYLNHYAHVGEQHSECFIMSTDLLGGIIRVLLVPVEYDSKVVDLYILQA